MSDEVHLGGTLLNTEPRLTGEPIKRILCKKTDRLVGYLYQWNNGDLQPAWFDYSMRNVRYEPMEQDMAQSQIDLQTPRQHSHDPSHLEICLAPKSVSTLLDNLPTGSPER